MGKNFVTWLDDVDPDQVGGADHHESTGIPIRKRRKKNEAKEPYARPSKARINRQGEDGTRAEKNAPE